MRMTRTQRAIGVGIVALASQVGSGGGVAAQRIPECQDAQTPEWCAPNSSKVPETWYCVTKWHEGADPEFERAAMGVFAWRLFLATNWPGRGEWPQWEALTGDPKKLFQQLNEPNTHPRWESWHDARRLFDALKNQKVLGFVPPPAGEKGPGRDGDSLTSELHGPGFDADDGKSFVYDQNAGKTYYESRVNKTWFVHVCRIVKGEKNCPEFDKNDKSSADMTFRHGQCKGQPDPSVNLGSDEYTKDGAVAVKLAWRVLTPGEIGKQRFLERHGNFAACGDAKACTLGLVGFHITQKTSRYSNWIWSTFEHVDNVPDPKAPTGDKTQSYSYHDPDCDFPTCSRNWSARYPEGPRGTCRTQIERTEAIAPEVQKLNQEVHQWLGSKSVFKNYQLIGVQYKPAVGQNQSSEFTPLGLRNAVIETYQVRASNQDPPKLPCGGKPSGKVSSCGSCHETASTGRAHDQDFNFVVQQHLCRCRKAGPWLGDKDCKALSIDKEDDACGK